MMLRRTGKIVAFLDLNIGDPFFAHNKVWVRTDFSAAMEFGSTRIGYDGYRSVCNFLIDGKMEPERGPYDHKGETCEAVEALEWSTDASVSVVADKLHRANETILRQAEALEKSGKAQVYRDGFAAAITTVESIRTTAADWSEKTHKKITDILTRSLVSMKEKPGA